MIYIKKVLNSSVVLVDKEGQEMIALGKGIGYGKKVGDSIADTQIDQVFLPIDEKNRVSLPIWWMRFRCTILK